MNFIFLIKRSTPMEAKTTQMRTFQMMILMKKLSLALKKAMGQAANLTQNLKKMTLMNKSSYQ
jgi:hypothetical protein